MTPRLDTNQASPEAIKALMSLERALSALDIDATLADLVRLRASQINGCTYCVDLHSNEARRRGETERRLHCVVAWRDAPFFTDRERAVLAWTESLTLLPTSHAPDEDYAALRAHCSEAECVNLSLLIGAINTWNRLSVGFRKTPST